LPQFIANFTQYFALFAMLLAPPANTQIITNTPAFLSLSTGNINTLPVFYAGHNTDNSNTLQNAIVYLAMGSVEASTKNFALFFEKALTNLGTDFTLTHLTMAIYGFMRGAGLPNTDPLFAVSAFFVHPQTQILYWLGTPNAGFSCTTTQNAAQPQLTINTLEEIAVFELGQSQNANIVGWQLFPDTQRIPDKKTSLQPNFFPDQTWNDLPFIGLYPDKLIAAPTTQLADENEITQQIPPHSNKKKPSSFTFNWRLFFSTILGLLLTSLVAYAFYIKFFTNRDAEKAQTDLKLAEQHITNKNYNQAIDLLLPYVQQKQVLNGVFTRDTNYMPKIRQAIQEANQQKLFSQAQDEAKAGNTTQALLWLKQLLQLNPKHKEGKSLEKKLTQVAAQKVALLLKQADYEIKIKQFEEAKKYLLEALLYNDTSQTILSKLDTCNNKPIQPASNQSSIIS
jgi:hypothetical protein